MIYIHSASQPEFSFQPFDEQTEPIAMGKFSLHAIHTPGHSPDSICILLKDEDQQVINAFTGDTLFIGFVGRPDLRETTFTHDATREILARQMYHSIQEKLLKLDDEVVVYPAHGSGSLCGKNLSSLTSSTIGAERFSNIALQPMSETSFVDLLLADQPMVPKYFPHSVASNRKKDLAAFKQAVDSVLKLVDQDNDSSILLIDPASVEEFKRLHLKNSINIPGDGKFETWLGAIVSPEEKFALLGENDHTLFKLAERIVNIGYEENFMGYVPPRREQQISSSPIDLPAFTKDPDLYTILDVRSASERKSQPIFENSIHIPLHQLRERIVEIPLEKPIVTHCGGVNRGAIAASILEVNHFIVYDLGFQTKQFIPVSANS
jgi:hydroxyacylglutathione hydrolase